MANIWTYVYTGTVQEWTVPRNGIYKIDLYGAQGGDVSANGKTANGGLGGHLTQYVELTAGTKLYITVGGHNRFNGGGAGSWSNDRKSVGGNGGGATHISTTSGLLKDVYTTVLGVAGGGAGGYIQGYDYQNSGFTTDHFGSTIGNATYFPTNVSPDGAVGSGGGYNDGVGSLSNGVPCGAYGQSRAVSNTPSGYTNSVLNRVRSGNGYAQIELITSGLNVYLGSTEINTIKLGNVDIADIKIGV